MSMFKAKVLLLGPMESGKTVLANFLCKATEVTNISPTVGVRIMEFEQPMILDGRNTVADIELWDCSGDHRYESCWAAFSKDANGIIFVYNPDRTNHNKELEELLAYFLPQTGLTTNHCFCVSNVRAEAYNAPVRSELPPSFQNIQCIEANLESSSADLREQLEKFLMTVLVAMTDKRDQEELSIMNKR
ncbi:intraflagellar transport protein 22 homolog isoform X1 [Octopus bimaculoides]|uniref:intraflagellar transport protein 22 homolog isoform X1 n=1 Tax=Octopus bimaculoides TaxID=37653 RepID=UPI00071E0369|nr:intraflagellar transport protein 22 homolog isoform X1 [Octopus bimaculoides]|eukprot:XP_014773442.1 PREDICTED: intraflagellar transport protein 22 homolog isoform X1 [Octopus bimaculoides]